MDAPPRTKLDSERLTTFAALALAGFCIEWVVTRTAVVRCGALLVRRVRAAARQLRGATSDDFLMHVATLTDPLMRFAATELVVLYYGLVGPRLRRRLRPEEFSYTEKSGLGGLLFALGLVTAMEGLGAHLLVHVWSPRVAWLLMALNAYALVWLSATYQAARLRPIALSHGHLLVRSSLRWTSEVPLDTIASVTAIAEVPRGKGVLRAALGVAPVLLLTLTHPVVARGPFGIHRSVQRIALYVDEPTRLRAALQRAFARMPRGTR